MAQKVHLNKSSDVWLTSGGAAFQSDQLHTMQSIRLATDTYICHSSATRLELKEEFNDSKRHQLQWVPNVPTMCYSGMIFNSSLCSSLCFVLLVFLIDYYFASFHLVIALV